MKVCVDELSKLPVINVVIESVDLSLYIAHATIADEERVIADRHGKVLKTRNLLEMQRAIKKAVSCELFLGSVALTMRWWGINTRRPITVWSYRWVRSRCPNG